MLQGIIWSIKQQVFLDPTYQFCPNFTDDQKEALYEVHEGQLAGCNITLDQMMDF
jgi:hypothetical protein